MVDVPSSSHWWIFPVTRVLHHRKSERSEESIGSILLSCASHTKAGRPDACYFITVHSTHCQTAEVPVQALGSRSVTPVRAKCCKCAKSFMSQIVDRFLAGRKVHNIRDTGSDWTVTNYYLEEYYHTSRTQDPGISWEYGVYRCRKEDDAGTGIPDRLLFWMLLLREAFLQRRKRLVTKVHASVFRVGLRPAPCPWFSCTTGSGWRSMVPESWLRCSYHMEPCMARSLR